MNKNWGYFAGASILVACLLLSHGVPVLAVVAGIGGVAMHLRRTSRAA